MSDRINEIRKRLAAATPGPWLWCYDGSSTWSIGPHDPQVERVARTERYKNDWDAGSANAQLIANAPTDIAFLLSRLEAAEKALRASERVINSFRYEGTIDELIDKMGVALAAYDKRRGE